MSRSAMEPEDEKKKINDDMVVFMRKRSETEAPRYTARLKTYLDFQQKHRRAANARRHSGGHHDKKPNSVSRKRNDGDVKDKGAENHRRGGDKCMHRTHSLSRSTCEDPEDRCGRQRRMKRGRRPRRMKCGRRPRRRRSCRRKKRQRSCRRRRRRSCSRRRRRRSCRRKRRLGGCRSRRRRRC